MANDRNKVSLFKIEAVYGTDAAPTAAANALLTRNARLRPLSGDAIERPLDLPSYGARPSGFANERGEFEFELELAGSGAAGTAPAWMQVLQVMGFAAPVANVTPTRMTQALISSDGGSATLALNIDNLLHRQLGVRGTAEFVFEANGLPYMACRTIGLLPAGSPVSEQAAPVPVLTAWRDPVPCNTANTTLSIDGYAAITRSIRFALGNNTPYRSLIGARAVRLTNREITGTLVIEMPNPTAKDFLGLSKARTYVPIALTHGTVAGNILNFSLPRCVLDAPEYSAEDDVTMLSLQFSAIINAGNDELLVEAR
jgi:hypothetical protein